MRVRKLFHLKKSLISSFERNRYVGRPSFPGWSIGRWGDKKTTTNGAKKGGKEKKSFRKICCWQGKLAEGPREKIAAPFSKIDIFFCSTYTKLSRLNVLWRSCEYTTTQYCFLFYVVWFFFLKYALFYGKAACVINLSR